MPIHGSLFTDFQEIASNQQFQLQNKKLLKVMMNFGPVQCLEGSMVAYQGDVRFQKKSQGMGRMLKGAVTGEGVSLMEAGGQGELFLASRAQEVQVMYLENDMVTINGSSILAFSSSIQWDIQRVQGKGAKALMGGAMAGGLFNVVLRGTGYVAVTTDGEPVALDVASAPTFADPQAVVLWTAGVTTSLNADSGGLGTMLRGGTGETFQVAFGGQGYVLIQPSEGVVQGASQPSSGGIFG
ncbi:MAG: AIM24 family protein [Cellulomonas sp.]|jgi:uncharacterized protein (AIM24 family)|nr:AIM24 family protein [Cellulomonas sp.]